MIVNFAERAHSHNWDLDPIVRSLLDTDFYKLLMLQFIWKHYPTTRVSFSLINRTSSVRLADSIPRSVLVQHLEHIRSLRLGKSELIWAGRQHLLTALAASSSQPLSTGWRRIFASAITKFACTTANMH